ncbi:MAG: energy-coupling factor transporter ATPase [Bacilli bacterium]|nr:energy-coupling factor transporter ATPase [Mollicutes bacterium]MDY3899880.1 energy-coupling factor transporter ATPase [Bacilli bacterium]
MKIEFKNVCFKYDDDSRLDDVIKNISFEIKPGEMISILGHNGSGKSTIAKLMMGLLQPDSGSIYINNVDTTDNNITETELDKLHAKMGIIFQNPDNQFVGVTVQDDIAFGLENHQIPRDEMIERINKYAKLVNMEKYLLVSPEDLSGGQKQRVAIAGALAMETETIIFDEATSMLDPKGTSEIIEMIKKLKKESTKTIITITHNLEEAVFADRVIVLNEGHIVLDGKPQEVLKEKEILEASGLTLLDSLDIMNKIKNLNITKKKELEEALWDLTFKM